MALSDIFSGSFFLIIGIVLILVGAAGMYFSQLIIQQNQKMNGMVDLITTMAQEMDFIRSRIQVGGIQNTGGVTNKNIHTVSMIPSLEKIDEGLIEVSDDDEEEDDDEEDDEEEDDEEEDDEEEDEEEDVEDEKNTIIISSLNLESSEEANENIKVINLGESTNTVETEIHSELEEMDDSSSSSDEESVLENGAMDLTMLKMIDIQLDNKNDMNIDYKKLSIDKLKSLVLERKLVENANKLKKPELLKLLEENDK
jgi:hypothetical protein